MRFFSNLFKKKPIEIISIPEVIATNVEPSALSNFGVKSIWATVKSDSTQAVLECLDFNKIEKTSWADGMHSIGHSGFSDIFITEPFDGWVFLIGWGLPKPLTTGINDISTFINALSLKFGECQYFVSQRTTDTASWIKSINGEVTRAYLISDGMSLIIGAPTKVEEDIDLVDLNSPLADTDEYFDTHVHPGIEEVLKISASWSVSPSSIEEYDYREKGTGYKASLK